MYMKSSKWSDKKFFIIDYYKKRRWGIECIKCGQENRVEFHHNYYPESISDTNLSDIDILCHQCHALWSEICPGGIQNQNMEQNFIFYISNKPPVEQSKFINLLKEKINKDDSDISCFFLKEEVSDYTKEANKKTSLQIWGCLISTFFMVIGVLVNIGLISNIGIIGFFIFIFLIKNTKNKPDEFDVFEERRNSLNYKRVIYERLFNGNILKENN